MNPSQATDPELSIDAAENDSTQEPILKAIHLAKTFGGRKVVDDVSFLVEQGEIVGLLGPNGAGKTTSFRMTCGLIDADEGQVFLNGIDITDWPMYLRARDGGM